MINPNMHSINFQSPQFKQHQQPFQQVVYSTQKLQHINMIIPPVSNLGRIYIGDTVALLKPEILEQNNIHAVLCCNHEAASHLKRIPTKIIFKFMEMQDYQDYPIQIHFESAFEFIQKNRNQGKNVLVQCHAGVSRSTTIVCSYLIQKHKIRAQEALRLVKQKRLRAKPNRGFWVRLQQFAQSILNEETKSIKKYPETEKKEKSMNQNEQQIKQGGKKISFMSPSKVDNTKKFETQKKSINFRGQNRNFISQNECRINQVNSIPKINFASSQCAEPPSYSRMTEKPQYSNVNTYFNNREHKNNQRLLLVNKSLNGDTFNNRNLLITPQKNRDTRFIHSPSKYESIGNYSSLNRNFSLQKNVRPLQ